MGMRLDQDFVDADRELLDGPAAGQAALYLMSRGLADEAELGHLVDIGVFVDVLAASLDDPQELCEMFSEATQAADQYNALEQMVRHPAPESELVLDALGQHLTDKKLAKAARKAAVVGWPTAPDTRERPQNASVARRVAYRRGRSR